MATNLSGFDGFGEPTPLGNAMLVMSSSGYFLFLDLTTYGFCHETKVGVTYTRMGPVLICQYSYVHLVSGSFTYILIRICPGPGVGVFTSTMLVEISPGLS